MIFTTSPYERSHGKRPQGTGSWAFQRTTTDVAFDGDLYGKIEFFTGTLSEAKKQCKSFFADQFGDCEITVAVLP